MLECFCMAIHDDPEFLEALQKIFATRSDIKAIADYQQKLYTSLSDLNASHRSVHEHVRTLAESHDRGRDTTDTLVRAREDLERLLRNLEQAHTQTQNEVRRAAQELYQVQQEIRKIPQLEAKLQRLEQELNNALRGGQSEERMNKDQEERIRREERMNKEQEERIRRLESRR
jgi:uncharacterized phage infection (PIP) family protein YhgE